MKRLGFNIVLLGMIASGKETQANILKKKYQLQFVETGVYSRKLLKEKSKNGEWARQTTGKGQPLPVPLMKAFLIKSIKDKLKNKNLLFLGARLKPEAQLLKKMLDARKEEFIAFYITLPDKEVYKRSLKRKEGNMKAIYKVFDTKNLIAKRIAWHKDQVGKTVKYWKSLGKMTIINGNQPILKVTKDILKAIEEYKKFIRVL
ncbi:MAG TPA: nucleoside monophosphate kinase [Candidatus Paceibacterota bacterium]|jgi:adenylate kinase family enzyme|nr:nucleoside monophosphate kinase [Candidatus Paceibacterota bacterium]